MEGRRRQHPEAQRHSDLGGTMRLGAQSSDVANGTLAHEIYGDVVTERHRHRYEANVNYLDQLRKAGLVISALTQREQLTEIVELPQSVHPWFVGVQFHPEFKSTPWDGHPLFNAFIKAALDHQAAGKRKPEGRGAFGIAPESPMKLCGFDVGLHRPFFLIAGPCVIESEQLQMDVAGTLKEIAGAGHPVHLQEQLRQGQPLQRQQLSAARAWNAAWRSWPR
jgi:hypothetical protein